MTPRDEAIEAVARALYDQRANGIFGPYDAAINSGMRAAFEFSAAAIVDHITPLLTRAALDAEAAKMPNRRAYQVGVAVGKASAQTALDAAEARLREAETLLARSLVFDHGSAEEGCEFLGGWDAMTQLVEAHQSTKGKS